MTLIVGFRCGDSAVLCSDSQETRGDLKTNVNKLPVQRSLKGGMDIVCGGAGNGDLTDRFRATVLAQMKRSSTTGEESIRSELEATLVAFHESPAFKTYPADQNDKFIAGLIAVRSSRSEVWLYKYFGTVIEPIETYALAGEDYAYFKRLIERRYRPGTSINQAVIMGLEAISEGRDTSTFIGGPTRVVIATPQDGIRTEEPSRVKWAEAQLSTQNQIFDSLRFELSSTGLEVKKQLKTFGNSITAMHNVYGTRYPAWPTMKPNLPDDDDSK